MNTSQLIRSYFFLLCITINIGMSAQVGIPGAPPQAPMLSPEDEKMLMQLDQEIDKFVGSLSSDEQQKFWKDVAELQDAMSNMNEDELEKFVNGVFSGEITELPIAKEELKKPEEPKPTVPSAPKPAAPTKPIVPPTPPAESSAVKDIVEILDIIIDNIETLLQKVQIIPEFEIKVERWVRDNDIRSWPKNARWNTVKLQMNEFVQKLYAIKDRDAKSKAYKYIDTVIANKSLINNLRQLMTVLKKNVPTIEVPEFGEIQLSKSSRASVQETISILNESMSLVKIPQELQAIFEGYSSIAEQLKAEEQKARQEALKQPRTPVTSYRPSYPTYEPSYGYDEDDYEPSYIPSARPYQPYQPTIPTGVPSVPSTPGMTPSRGPSSTPSGEKPAGASTKPLTDKEKKESEAKKQKENAEVKQKAAKDRAAKKEAAAVAETDVVAETYIDEIGTNLEKIIEVLNEHDGLLKNMKKHLTDTSALNNEVALVSLPSAIKHINRAVDKVKTLARRVNNMKTEAQKKKYRGALKGKAFDKQFQLLETVAKDIDSIKSTWDSIKDKVSANKQYAYLGGMSADKADNVIKKLISTPSSLYGLQSAITKLLDAKKTLEKGPEPKRMAPGRRIS
jgi:hypothetical protein